MNRFPLSLLALCLALGAVLPARATEAHDHDHAELPGQSVELSERAQRLIGLACEEVQHRALTAVKPLWGRFESAPEALAQAISPAVGRVTFHVRPLQRVQAGDLLAEVALSPSEAGEALPVVPERALCCIGLEPVLFLQDPEDADRFVAFPVELGERANGWVQLTNLPPSEHPWRFVARGQYELRLALAQSASGAKPAHFHADGQLHEGED